MSISKIYYLRVDASDISGYNALLESNGTSTNYIQGGGAQKKFVTPSGNPSAIGTIANTKTWYGHIYNPGPAQLAHVIYTLYKRNTAGTETQILSGDLINQTVESGYYATVSANFSIPAVALAETDRIVLKVDLADSGGNICFYWGDSSASSRIYIDFNKKYTYSASEIIALIENYFKKTIKFFSEAISTLENYFKKTIKFFSEAISTLETTQKKVFKSITEALVGIENIIKTFFRYFSENLSLLEVYSVVRIWITTIIDTLILRESQLIFRKIYSGGEWIWTYVFRPTYYKARSLANDIWNKLRTIRGK